MQNFLRLRHSRTEWPFSEQLDRKWARWGRLGPFGGQGLKMLKMNLLSVPWGHRPYFFINLTFYFTARPHCFMNLTFYFTACPHGFMNLTFYFTARPHGFMNLAFYFTARAHCLMDLTFYLTAALWLPVGCLLDTLGSHWLSRLPQPQILANGIKAVCKTMGSLVHASAFAQGICTVNW